jgi:chromosome segregation ATPase
MIPVRLKLRNFMSYRGDLPGFSFAGIHTACISGENGAGKSSLIDAMTWALWGKTRAASDDELISIGLKRWKSSSISTLRRTFTGSSANAVKQKVGSAGIILT